ncbi:MAG: hypothetical protein K6F53_04860, partial [Lachnospiraceae bacterium]|nr:hypothetical protein [Lachnospiraceae bacterium]
MSYHVKYTKISADYREDGYSFSFPEQLSEESRHLLKRILYSYNRIYTGTSDREPSSADFPDGVWFFLLEEGAVLFGIRRYEWEDCCGAGLCGLFFEREYIPTAWLMIDKLIRLVRSDCFLSIDAEILFEDELDRIIAESAPDGPAIDPEEDTEPFSFAWAALDPHLDHARYLPNVSGGCFERTLRRKKERNLDFVFSMNTVFPNSFTETKYKTVLLEQNPDGTSGIFGNGGSARHPWRIKISK